MRFRMIQEGEYFSDDPDVADVKVIDGALQVIVRRDESTREYYEAKNAIKPGNGQIGVNLQLLLIRREERKNAG